MVRYKTKTVGSVVIKSGFCKVFFCFCFGRDITESLNMGEKI